MVGFSQETDTKEELWRISYENGETGDMPTDRVKKFFKPARHVEKKGAEGIEMKKEGHVCGAELQPQKGNKVQLWCNDCGEMVGNETAYGCRKCNYDLCQQCHKLCELKIDVKMETIEECRQAVNELRRLLEGINKKLMKRTIELEKTVELQKEQIQKLSQSVVRCDGAVEEFKARVNKVENNVKLVAMAKDVVKKGIDGMPKAGVHTGGKKADNPGSCFEVVFCGMGEGQPGEDEQDVIRQALESVGVKGVRRVMRYGTRKPWKQGKGRFVRVELEASARSNLDQSKDKIRKAGMFFVDSEKPFSWSQRSSKAAPPDAKQQGPQMRKNAAGYWRVDQPLAQAIARQGQFHTMNMLPPHAQLPQDGPQAQALPHTPARAGPARYSYNQRSGYETTHIRPQHSGVGSDQADTPPGTILVHGAWYRRV